MNATTTIPPAFDWPADVLAAAREGGIADALEPLRQVTLALFPTLSSLTVSAEPDPEIAGLTFIVFDVTVPRSDVPDPIAASRGWDAEMHRHCEPTHGTFVILALHREGA